MWMSCLVMIAVVAWVLLLLGICLLLGCYVVLLFVDVD